MSISRNNLWAKNYQIFLANMWLVVPQKNSIKGEPTNANIGYSTTKEKNEALDILVLSFFPFILNIFVSQENTFCP